MTRTVSCLAELGLVTKTPDPTDGRQVVVALTPAGVAEVTETRRRRDAWLNSRLARLTAEDRDVLSRAAELLREMADS
jgi:DNA-binding MarR family transcriptional regulator